MKSTICTGANSLNIASVNKPIKKPNHHLIKVLYSGLNPTDWKHLHEGNHYYTMTKSNENKPFQLGCEGYGIIIEPDDPKSQIYKKNAKVYFLLGKGYGQANQGSLTEFINVSTQHVAIAPRKISPAQIAVTPLTLLTAYQSLRDGGYYEPNCGLGKSILIHAGAGGVGHMAIQLCANVYKFDRIVCTCSHDNIDFVKSIGATDVVNYKLEDFVEKYNGNKFDVVLDTVGGEPTFFYGIFASKSKLANYLYRSKLVTKKDGKTIGLLTGATLYGAPLGMFGSMAFSFLPGLLYYKLIGNILCNCNEPEYVGPYFIPTPSNMATYGSDLTILAKYIDEGLIVPCVYKEYKLHDVQNALNHLKMHGGHIGGMTKNSNLKKKKESFRGKIAVNLMNE